MGGKKNFIVAVAVGLYSSLAFPVRAESLRRLMLTDLMLTMRERVAGSRSLRISVSTQRRLLLDAVGAAFPDYYYDAGEVVGDAF